MKKSTKIQNLPYTAKRISYTDKVLSPWRANEKKSSILFKMNNMQQHAVENRNPIEALFLHAQTFIDFFEPQYKYLCSLFNVAPYSQQASRLISLRWVNDGNKALPITRNTVAWFGPLAQLQNQFTQTTVEDQYITAGFLHQHMFDLSKKEGAKLKTNFKVKIPYKNNKVLDCYRISVLNLDLEDRQLSIEKDRSTGEYYFKEWDPYKDPKPENYHDLTPMKDIVAKIVDYPTMKSINQKVKPKERGFQSLLNKTGHRHLADLMKTLGLKELQAFKTLMLANPYLVNFADGPGSVSIAELAKSINRAKAKEGRYKVVDHYGFPVSQDGETISRLTHFFTRYTEGGLRGAIYKGSPIRQAGKEYYISMAGGDMSRLPLHIQDRNHAIELSFTIVENLLRPHLGTTLTKPTVQAYGLAASRFTTHEIADILKMQPSEVDNHIAIANNVLTNNQTPPSFLTANQSQQTAEVIDRSLYMFGKLPKMKNYAAEIFNNFNLAPIHMKQAGKQT